MAQEHGAAGNGEDEPKAARGDRSASSGTPGDARPAESADARDQEAGDRDDVTRGDGDAGGERGAGSAPGRADAG
ncbi:hypothetical protein HCJ92_23660, partial [Streptomyces sp. ventii]|nr:hypothetical protein [Streptomyces spiramenti]